MKIVLDTNFVIYAVHYNIFHQLEKPGVTVIVPSVVVDELEKLSEKEKKAKDREAAKLALHIIYQTNIKIVKTLKKGDDAVLEAAEKENASIATLDEGLVRRAGARRIKTVGIRQKRYVSL